MIIDLHQDILLHEKHPEMFQNKQTSLTDIINSDINVCFATSFPIPPQNGSWDNKQVEETLCQLNEYNQIAKENSNLHILLDKNIEFDKTNLILHIEGIYGMDRNNLDLIKKYYQLGVRSFGLVWNDSNQLCGGTNDPTKGLTGYGEIVLSWLIGKKVIIDLAHISKKGFYDVAKILKKPIFVSHGNCDAIAKSNRNYDDDQIKIIAESNGLIGVFFSKKYTGGKTIEKLISHIKHIENIGGIDHVGIGSDLGGITSGLIEDLSNVHDLANLKNKLYESGLSNEKIEKIFYKNANRIINSYL